MSTSSGSADSAPERASRFGVATSYEDWSGARVDVAPEVVDAVLDQLGDEPPPEHRAPTGVRLKRPPRCWGWSVQVYALWSADSWGMGDLADLRQLVRASAALGAGVVLVNPLHAVAPVHPITASPYSPTSRRYVNPLYLRIEDIPEYGDAPADVRAAVDACRIDPPDPAGLVDRDAVWDAKHAALHALWAQARDFEPDPDLQDFATFCALAEEHGLPWTDWPADLHDPTGPAVAEAQERLADRTAFHAWLQVLCDEQLAAVQAEAVAGGMPIGVVHDLAVGVDPGGADAWALQDVLASTVTVGAPPDSFNQKGQDWALPPWRPDVLAAQDYAPYRLMLEAVLARGGGIRVDHVMGLSRLWWVPPGNTADAGTYVSYDENALLDLLVEAANERGGVVVGEDLGTVEPRMREALAARGILGSAVLWFERVDDDPQGPPKPPEQWRELAMASVSTHDLPTAYGMLAGEQVRVRHELGQLGRPLADEQRQADAEKKALVEALIAAGTLAASDAETPDAVVLAMHRLLALTPSRILLASPYDVLGELRQPNLPGTTDEYPNWRIPLSAPLGEWLADPRVAATADALSRDPEG